MQHFEIIDAKKNPEQTGFFKIIEYKKFKLLVLQPSI